MPSKIRSVKCDSGLTGWQARLQDNYDTREEFERYDDNYAISTRLGFESAEDCWEQNPLVQGSVNPSDLRVVR